MYNWKTLGVLGLLLNIQGTVQAQRRLTVIAPPMTAQEVRSHDLKARLYALTVRFQEDDKEASARITHILRACKDPQLLSAAALWSIQRMQSHHCDGQCFICNRYEGIRDESLLALAALHTPEASRQLVNVLTAKLGYWDGHAAETMALAITKAGKSTLPFLERSPANSSFVRLLIKAVKAGQILD